MHHPHRADHEPTPEEIRRECELIQAEWSDEERRQRAGLRREPKEWTVPRLRTPAEVVE